MESNGAYDCCFGVYLADVFCGAVSLRKSNMLDVFKSYGMKGQGPGGMKCRCCGPAPGHEKHIMRRQARARLKAFDRKDQGEQRNG